MNRKLYCVIMIGVCLAAAMPALAAKTKRAAAGPAPLSRNPYIGAIAIDAADGRELFADNADATAYPASIVKLMNLIVILDKIKHGDLKLTDTVKVTAESAKIGGSQVYLKENETFTVDELLYAMMVQSANDAATALALHVAGSKDAFVELMNQKAKEIGLQNTHFASVHGLPPANGQSHDTTTPRDLASLARTAIQDPDTLRYSSTRERMFRGGATMLRNHNHLLGTVEGCDGLKTGYFFIAGFSIVATAQRNNARVITVIMGSQTSQIRDLKARELLLQGLAKASSVKPPDPLAIAVAPPMPPPAPASRAWHKLAGALAGGLCIGFITGYLVRAATAGNNRKG